LKEQRLILVFLQTLLLSSSVLAQDNKDIKTKLTFNETLHKIESTLNIVNKKLNLSSKYIDEFVTNKKDNTLYTYSYIRIETTLEKVESDSMNFEPNIDIRLHLPKLKEKLSITIDNNDNRINNKYQDSNEKIHYKDDKYNIGLLYNTINNNFNIKLNAGVKVTKSPYLFTKLDIKKNLKINNKNHLTLEQRFKYSNKFELDSYSIINYTHKLNQNLDISNYNEYYINSDIKNDNLYTSLRLSQKIKKNSYINYVTSIDSNDEKSNFKIKEYKTYISYRKFLRNWFYYDIVPSISWKRENNFKDKIGIKLNLGIIIGN
jgi:hypothetical protein